MQCIYCNYKCKSKGCISGTGILGHYMRKHSEKSPIECTQCELFFDIIDLIKSHLEKDHIIERKFKCYKFDFLGED